MTANGYCAGVPAIPTLAQVVGLLEERAEPSLAEEWDRVGLVSGDPGAPCRSVRFTVDVTEGVVASAIADGVDLLVAHHPLLLRGVHSIAQTTARGRILADLVRADCGLLTMHTNADRADGGVNDALADAVGMNAADRTAIEPNQEQGPARIVVFAPAADSDGVVAAMAAAGAGRIGEYDWCAFWAEGTGQFRPSPAANPHTGVVGEITTVGERRIEMVLPPGAEGDVVFAMQRAHPYEEPAFSVIPSAPVPQRGGLGRWGSVAPTTTGEIAARLAEVLPANAAGVKITGDPERPVATVAVCGGSGDSLLPAVGRLPVDVFVTSDLRHHPAADFIADHDIALVDIPHAAGEALWLESWSRDLASRAAAGDWSLQSSVAPGCTDPWTGHYAGRNTDEG